MSPEPVTMNLSSVEMSQLNTDDVSFDCKYEEKEANVSIYMFERKEKRNRILFDVIEWL